jgi:hypothetical protein
MIISMFGHEINDPDIREDCHEVAGIEPFKTRFWRQVYLLPYMLFPKYFVNHYSQVIHKEKYVLDEDYPTPLDMYTDMCNKANRIFNVSIDLH